MENRYAPQPVAGWYPVAAFGSLAIMALASLALIVHLMTDPATLPLDQRALFEAEPKWVFAVSVIAFAAGLLGAVLQVLRRASAERVLLISLLGMLVWLGGMFATPAFRDLLSIDQIAVLVAIVAISWTIYWFARHSRQRGWLR